MTVRIHTSIWKIALGSRSDLHSVEKLNVASNILDMHFDFRDCSYFLVRLSVKVRAFAERDYFACRL